MFFALNAYLTSSFHTFSYSVPQPNQSWMNFFHYWPRFNTAVLNPSDMCNYMKLFIIKKLFLFIEKLRVFNPARMKYFHVVERKTVHLIRLIINGAKHHRHIRFTSNNLWIMFGMQELNFVARAPVKTAEQRIKHCGGAFHSFKNNFRGRIELQSI